jgi:hypothetical protein
MRLPAEDLKEVEAWLGEQYIQNRIRGEAVETRLRTSFDSDDPRRHWHAAMDLLTVRYFRLLDPGNTAILEINAGPDHSGLDISELADPKTVLDAYRTRLGEAIDAVRDHPTLGLRGGRGRPAMTA